MTEPSTDHDSKANNGPENGPSVVPDISDIVADAASGPEHHDAATSGEDKVQPEDAHNPSNIMILWPQRRHSEADETFSRKRSGRSSVHRRRRLAALSAVAAVAAICGAAGGSLTTIALGHMVAPQETRQETPTAAADGTALLKDAVARITADVSGLRTDLDRAGKTRSAQIGKLGDRLDKVEKSQEDATTRIARLSETQDKVQDKLRAANAATAPETTGSIAARAETKADARKPVIVGGWTLSRVSGGGAIVDGPDGLFEIYPGDPLPGLGRVDAVRYQDGRWVVVTPKGLIVRR